MTALRLGGDKQTLIQGMKLLTSILDVLNNKDARKILNESIAMSEDEVRFARESKAYVENAAKMKAEIAAQKAEADRQLEEAQKATQDAKNAMVISKKALTEHEQRIGALMDKHAKKEADLAVREKAHSEEKERIEKISLHLDEQAKKQTAKQAQLDELEQKLRGKATAAAELMKQLS